MNCKHCERAIKDNGTVYVHVHSNFQNCSAGEVLNTIAAPAPSLSGQTPPQWDGRNCSSTHHAYDEYCTNNRRTDVHDRRAEPQPPTQVKEAIAAILPYVQCKEPCQIKLGMYCECGRGQAEEKLHHIYMTAGRASETSPPTLSKEATMFCDQCKKEVAQEVSDPRVVDAEVCTPCADKMESGEIA